MSTNNCLANRTIVSERCAQFTIENYAHNYSIKSIAKDTVPKYGGIDLSQSVVRKRIVKRPLTKYPRTSGCTSYGTLTIDTSDKLIIEEATCIDRRYCS